MEFLIDAGKPFPGHCLAMLEKNRTVAFTDNMTIKQYEAARGIKTRTVDDAEVFELSQAFNETLKTYPEAITEKQWMDSLEILPPRRWRYVGIWETFHISERITGNLVYWFARHDGRAFQFIDDALITPEKFLEKMKDATT